MNLTLSVGPHEKIMLTDRWPFLFNAIIDACIEWELKFPHITVQALSKEVSDHTPLFLNIGETTGVANPPITTTESLITVGTFTNDVETLGGDMYHHWSMA